MDRVIVVRTLGLLSVLVAAGTARSQSGVEPSEQSPYAFSAFQPGTQPSQPTVRPPAPRRTTPTTRRSTASTSYLRLARVPNMFGDSPGFGGQLIAVPARGQGNITGQFDLPMAAGAGRIKIAENNKALPVDRVYFTYNGFHNALSADPNLAAPGAHNFNIHRYSLGLEKTFLEGTWSVDVRMPLAERYGFSQGPFQSTGGEVGNLAIVLKRLLWAGTNSAAAIGIGIDTPTGSDVAGSVDTTDYLIHNDAVHLTPYFGILGSPNDFFFYHGFFQLDIPTNGNRLEVEGADSGILTDQNALYLDFAIGSWLFRDPSRYYITGVAALAEFHYTTTLQDADHVTVRNAGDRLTFGNTYNRLDVPNITVGIHTQVTELTDLRVSGVFPLDTGADRLFDSEIAVQVNRRY